MIELVEIEPGKYRIRRNNAPVASSALPRPYVISDTMPPTEQVDGKFYTSKSAFRAVGRALGLTEVGTEKFKAKQNAVVSRETKARRRATIRDAVQRHAAGHRPKVR